MSRSDVTSGAPHGRWSIRSPLVTMLLAATLVAGAPGAMAQGPSVPASAPSTAMPAGSQLPLDPLVEGLLQGGDLPPGMTAATAVQEGTDYDIGDAAFMANDGIRIVSRTWGMSGDAGASVVFDFRMQFPTPEAAAAYITAALPTLSETATTGLQPLTNVPVIGQDTHAFGLDTQGGSGPVTIRAYVFRVGSVAAKVLAGGGALSGDQAEAIARAAASRMGIAGPPAPGSPRPVPTPAPSLVASPAAPPPSGDLVSLLLAHVPAAIASTCAPDAQRLWEGELVTLVCSPTDADVEVTYSGFDTAEHMGAAYQSSLDTIDVSHPTTSCDLGTYTGPYQVDNEAAGQITCWSEANGRAIMWSDDRLSMLSVAVSPSLDPAGLYAWWLDAGPEP